MSTTNTAPKPPFANWMGGHECDCVASCESAGDDGVGHETNGIISAGQTLSLPSRGCSHFSKPMLLPVNPLRGEPLTGEPDAGDPPVRFGGRGRRTQSSLPTPITPKMSKLQRRLPAGLRRSDHDSNAGQRGALQFFHTFSSPCGSAFIRVLFSKTFALFTSVRGCNFEIIRESARLDNTENL